MSKKKQNHPPKWIARKIGWQLGFLVVLSLGIGWAYNAWSPRGVSLQGENPSRQVGAGKNSELGQAAAVAVAPQPFEHSGEMSENGFPVVTWEEVGRLVQTHGALLVDARPQWSYDAGHIQGAVCLPFSFPTTDDHRKFAQTYPTSRTLVLYCGDPACERSRYLAEKLKDEFGYTDVWLYEGGYEDYRQQSL